jgi:6-phosphogluconolactonase
VTGASPGPPTLRILADTAAVQRAAAEEFTVRMESAVRARGGGFVALSGGSTPRGLHRLLVDPTEPFRDRVDWGRLHVFWGDERPVGPEHPDSNYRMAHETLLHHVPIPPAHVYRIQGEDPEPPRAAIRYADELRHVFAAHGRLEAGVPRFDLVLLGMGADGHTASLFPHTGAVHETTGLVVATWVAKLGTQRISLTAPVLNHADAVLFLVTGGDKAEALHAVLEGPAEPDTYPSQIVRPVTGTLTWLVDQAAAARLTAPAGR